MQTEHQNRPVLRREEMNAIIRKHVKRHVINRRKLNQECCAMEGCRATAPHVDPGNLVHKYTQHLTGYVKRICTIL